MPFSSNIIVIQTFSTIAISLLADATMLLTVSPFLLAGNRVSDSQNATVKRNQVLDATGVHCERSQTLLFVSLFNCLFNCYMNDQICTAIIVPLEIVLRDKIWSWDKHFEIIEEKRKLFCIYCLCCFLFHSYAVLFPFNINILFNIKKSYVAILIIRNKFFANK